jgi:hypothetical protein
MNFFRKSQVVEQPDTTTPDDIVNDARKDFREAETKYADACRAMAAYNSKTRDNGLKALNGGTVFQINTDPERLLISSRVEHARHKRDITMAKLAALKEGYATHETKCIAGVPVRSHA